MEKQKRIEKLLTELRDLKEQLERLRTNHQGDMNNLVSKARAQAKTRRLEKDVKARTEREKRMAFA